MVCNLLKQFLYGMKYVRVNFKPLRTKLFFPSKVCNYYFKIFTGIVKPFPMQIMCLLYFVSQYDDCNRKKLSMN